MTAELHDRGRFKVAVKINPVTYVPVARFMEAMPFYSAKCAKSGGLFCMPDIYDNGLF